MHRSSRWAGGRSQLAVIALAGLVGTSACGPGPGPTPASASPTAAATPTPTGASAAPTTPAPTVLQPTVTWTAVDAHGDLPAARSGQTWTVDPSSAVAYLFGGRGGDGPLGDLWAYDMTADQWFRLATGGDAPAARDRHAAGWVDGLGLVVAGGSGASGVLGDLWSYDPTVGRWRALEPGGPRPPPRSGACTSVGPDGRLWMVGGQAEDGTYLDDLWTLEADGSQWIDVTVSGPGPTARADAGCWWAPDGRLVVYGGRSGAVPILGDLWALAAPESPGATWASITPPSAPGRFGAASVAASGSLLAAGGTGAAGGPLDDVIAFDPSALTATTYAGDGGPGARTAGSLVDDPEGERRLWFGGAGADGPTSEVWSLTLP